MKSVERINLQTRQRDVLATFTLDGERVVADWRDDDYRFGIEANGIMSLDGGPVRPEHGRAFYDALEGEYCTWSRLGVISSD